jgi:NACalpha-BTF3-like transcription factor
MHTIDFSDSIEDLKKANAEGSNAEVLFVMNKADCYDSEKENLKETVETTFIELKKLGFENPTVIPVSARAARLFKMALCEKIDFTKKEIYDFVYYIQFFTRPENNFSQLAARVIGETNKSIHYLSSCETDIVIEGISYKQEQITKALFNTGIPVVENILNIHKGKIK